MEFMQHQCMHMWILEDRTRNFVSFLLQELFAGECVVDGMSFGPPGDLPGVHYFIVVTRKAKVVWKRICAVWLDHLV
jgi:hypothetical protein